MTNVVAVEGGLTVDHLVTEGASAHFSVPGGPGLYACLGAAAALRHSGDDAAVRLLWPLSPHAHATIELLKDALIDLSHCPSGPALPRLWILNSAEGRRVLPTAAPVHGHELSENIDSAEKEQWQPSLGALTGVDVLLRSAPARPATNVPGQTIVVIDPDQRVIAAGGMTAFVTLSQGAHVLCPSRVQLSLIGPDPVQAALALRESTQRAVVARLDADGCLVLPSEGGAWRVWHERAVVVDTTGAGDSHAGALAASLATSLMTSPTRPAQLSTDILLAAARDATAIATCTVSAWGPDGLQNTPSPGHVHTEEIS